MWIDPNDETFNCVLQRIDKADLQQRFLQVTSDDVSRSVERAVAEAWLSASDLIALLSAEAASHIDEMARAAAALHLKYFGKALTLYQPLYIANYCENQCVYCGFNCKNQIERQQLSFEAIEAEAKAMTADGEIKQILILTGEAPGRSGYDYIKKAVQITERYFDSVSVEVYPLSTDEYRGLKAVGCDGLTVYQETYDRERYRTYHLKGRKTDFDWRLNTPERGAMAGLRSIGIGALYGLSDCTFDAFCTAMHGRYLSDKYSETEFSLSLPRIQPAVGDFVPVEIMDDAKFIQYLLAFRLFLPRLGINVSTRERKEMRNSLLGLGISRISAGSKTSVGGYRFAEPTTEDQFDIADNRTVAQMKADLTAMGYQIGRAHV